MCLINCGKSSRPFLTRCHNTESLYVCHKIRLNVIPVPSGRFLSSCLKWIGCTACDRCLAQGHSCASYSYDTLKDTPIIAELQLSFAGKEKCFQDARRHPSLAVNPRLELLRRAMTSSEDPRSRNHERYVASEVLTLNPLAGEQVGGEAEETSCWASLMK